ncbi:MAG TPA: hypothetical protein VFR02_03860, partial [bacterium]|nr:hypothetical protein [bacterium]
RFLEAGGNLIIGPSYLDREVQPDWLVRLTGGWREGDHAGQAVAPAPAGEKPQLQLLDEIDVANDASEAGHQCSTDGAVTLDRSKLPELPRLTKMLEDDGRVFKGYYQFSAKTEPGLPHRVWVRVNNGFNTAGTALLVKTDGGWVQAGVRTKNSGTDRDFLTFYFEVPAPLIGSDHTLFRLADKGRDPINAYHLWVFGLNAPDGRRSLAQALGFQVHQTLGRVDRGLIPLGGRWEEPLQLAEDPSQAALLAQRIGKGWLIRSQLNLGDSQGLMTALLHPGPDVGPSPTASAP